MNGEGQPPSGTIRDWIDRRSRQSPNHPAFLFTHDTAILTWATLRESARCIASRLKDCGIRRGESIAIMMPNGRRGLLAFLGSVYGGFRPAMINLAAGDRSIRYALENSGSRFALVGSGQRDQFERVRPGLIEVADETAGVSCTMLDEISASDDALLMYTSGTTGHPKGVLHAHSSLLAGGWTTRLAHKLTPDDRGLCVLPIHHINGLCVTVMGTIVSGGSLVIAPKFSSSRFWSDIKAFSVSWFSVVPTIVSHLVHSNIRPDDDVRNRVRFGRSASAPLSPGLQQDFEKSFGIPLIDTMGLTETAAQILSNPLPPGIRKSGSAGIAYGNDVAIAPLEQSTSVSGPDGEIVVRGPNVMTCYFRDKKATEQTFTSDGWLRTGDIGHMDDDGYVYVTGRLKELIIKGGENIAPREVDEALCQNVDVFEAAAFGVPCRTYGERVEAAVMLNATATSTATDLLDHCRSILGPFKSPDRIHVVDDFPRGPSGKIQRLELARLVAARKIQRTSR